MAADADPNPLNGRSKAVRLKCLDCCGGQPGEVRECTAYRCPLWEWRFGRPLRGTDPNVDEWKSKNVEEPEQ